MPSKRPQKPLSTKLFDKQPKRRKLPLAFDTEQVHSTPPPDNHNKSLPVPTLHALLPRKLYNTPPVGKYSDVDTTEVEKLREFIHTTKFQNTWN